MMNNNMMQQINDETKRIYNDLIELWPANSGDEALAEAMIQLIPEWCHEKVVETIDSIKAGIERGKAGYANFKEQMNSGKSLKEIIHEAVDKIQDEGDKHAVLRSMLDRLTGGKNIDADRFDELTTQEKVDEIASMADEMVENGSEDLVYSAIEAQSTGVQIAQSNHSDDEKGLAMAISRCAAEEMAAREDIEEPTATPEEIGQIAGAMTQAGVDIREAIVSNKNPRYAVAKILGLATAFVVTNKLAVCLGVKSFLLATAGAPFLSAIVSAIIGMAGLFVAASVGIRLGCLVAVGIEMLSDKVKSMFGSVAKPKVANDAKVQNKPKDHSEDEKPVRP